MRLSLTCRLPFWLMGGPFCAEMEQPCWAHGGCRGGGQGREEHMTLLHVPLPPNLLHQNMLQVQGDQTRRLGLGGACACPAVPDRRCNPGRKGGGCYITSFVQTSCLPRAPGLTEVAPCTNGRRVGESLVVGPVERPPLESRGWGSPRPQSGGADWPSTWFQTVTQPDASSSLGAP